MLDHVLVCVASIYFEYNSDSLCSSSKCCASMKEPYNAAQDSERKRALNLLLSHTKQQERKDVEV